MDPTKIHLDHSSRNPVLANEPTFQEIMGEQLAHAPWLLLSIAIHFIILFLLSLIPPSPPKKEEAVVSMSVPEKTPEILDEEQPPEEVKEEKQDEEPTLQDADVEPTETTS